MAIATLWPFLSPGQIVTAIDLTGATGGGRVWGMTVDQQVGDAFRHAAIWHGSAASFVDLNPEGALASELQATIGFWQSVPEHPERHRS